MRDVLVKRNGVSGTDRGERKCRLPCHAFADEMMEPDEVVVSAERGGRLVELSTSLFGITGFGDGLLELSGPS